MVHELVNDRVPVLSQLEHQVAAIEGGLGSGQQPRLDEPVAPAVDGLRRLLPALAGVHVFSWWPGTNRLPLAARTDLWAAVLDLLTREAEPRDLLLEFVPDDDSTVLAREAEILRRFIQARTDAAVVPAPW